MDKFYDKKTEWVVKGSFGVRRIWKDTEGHYFLVNNIAHRNYNEDLEVYKSPRVSDKGGSK